MNDLRPTHELLQFFEHEHLPPHLRAVSEPFCVLAHDLAALSDEFESRAAERIRQRMAEWEVEPHDNTEATWVWTKLGHAREWTWSNMPYRLDRVLRLVLEAKDCAVRAVLYKPVQP